jgi:hypothetical protein
MAATVIVGSANEKPELGSITFAEVAPAVEPTLDYSFRARGERLVMALAAEVIGDALRAISIANSLGQRAVNVAQNIGRSGSD